MDKIKIRQFYFAGLFSSVIYFSLLLIFIGKAENLQINDVYIYTVSLSSLTCAYIVLHRLKKSLFVLKTYKVNLILGHVPLILGFLFSLMDRNYIYLLIAFPIFLINYLILMPWSKNGLQKAD